MSQDSTMSKKIKAIEERLKSLENVEETPKTTGSLRRQNRRIKTLVHRNHGETLANTENIQHMNRIIFHIARKNHAQDATLTKLTRDRKEQTQEEE